jgi:hypothetical protein
MMAAFADAGPAWAAAGIVPLPIDGKRPLVSHPDRFGRRAALRIVPKFPDANLGFWCGYFNRLTVVDVDSAADAELQYALRTYGDSPIIVRTASGKHHAYYRHDGERRRIRPDKGHPIDILGEGGLAVAPPSVRASGGRYEFVRGGLADLANLPKMRRSALLDVQKTRGIEQPPPVGDPATIGRRNDSVFRLALALAHAAESQADLLAQARKANAELCTPPNDEAEVVRTVRKVWEYKLAVINGPRLGKRHHPAGRDDRAATGCRRDGCHSASGLAAEGPRRPAHDVRSLARGNAARAPDWILGQAPISPRRPQAL